MGYRKSGICSLSTSASHSPQTSAADDVPMHRRMKRCVRNSAAEVAHVLMMQCLFAPYSLWRPSQITGAKTTLVGESREVIAMGARKNENLVTSKNLIRSGGAPLSLALGALVGTVIFAGPTRASGGVHSIQVIRSSQDASDPARA